MKISFFMFSMQTRWLGQHIGKIEQLLLGLTHCDILERSLKSAFTKYKHVAKIRPDLKLLLKLKHFNSGSHSRSQKAFFEVGIRPKKVTSASGHGTKAKHWAVK